jgi:caffeoyl-CoA O-methyltransferase
MSNRSIGLSEELHEYILSASLRESDVRRRLREETAQHPKSDMQIAPEQAQFFQVLVRLMGARKTLEVGVFTGYSALSVAEALPANGRLVACEIDKEIGDVARGYWQEAGVADRIDLRIAPATETLDRLIAEGEAETFDFAFIDADKRRYDAHYERCLELVRAGGLIALDNVLRGGRVLNPEPESDGVRAVQELNAKIHDDDRVDVSMLPLADGVTLARKR